MIISIYIIFSALLGSFLASIIYRYVNKNIEADSYVGNINIYTEPSFCPAWIYFSALEGYDSILCEVNIMPPNPGSIRFHKRFDFKECGSQFTEGGTLESYDYSVEVQFLKRDLK